ncbi:hypothetical protein [Bradyrhizobium sp. 2TAF24]|uniref:hypothetical protein n=1 Tax=Bradyrhizobium sp. 2TAF24 TaxID=3233011 RepID=UPI003F93E6EF
MTGQGVAGRLTVRGWIPGWIRVALLLLVAGAVAGCAGGPAGNAGGPMAAMAAMPASTSGGNTVSFDSIDGPPPQVFDRFVRVLDSEAQSRNVTVVSRDGAASYRVRGYLAAQVRGGRTSIAWVWDVYDRNHNRALRLTGEEAGGKAGQDAWATADEALLRRIAQTGLISLSGFVNGTAPAEAPEPTAPAQAGPAIASAEGMTDISSTTGGGMALSFSAH